MKLFSLVKECMGHFLSAAVVQIVYNLLCDEAVIFVVFL
jgi:hypothetical protein